MITQCQPIDYTCNTRIDYTPVVVDGKSIPFVVELDLSLSVLDPMPGENQKFCYRLTGVGEDNSDFINLSHWVLSLCPEITADIIKNVTVTIGGVPQTVNQNNVKLFIPPQVDPPTGCSGLKFNFGLNIVLDGSDSVGLFCFELTTPYPVGDVDVCLSSGSKTASGLTICGPACPPPLTVCEATVSQLVDVCVPITIKPFTHVGCATTICCGEPTIGAPPCNGTVGGECTFTVSQLICVEVPVKFGAKATQGATSVVCDSAYPNECSCPVTLE